MQNSNMPRHSWPIITAVVMWVVVFAGVIATGFLY